MYGSIVTLIDTVHYINDLEARVAWLESVVREHAPGVGLDGEQNHQYTVNGARTLESPRSLEEAATTITTSRGYSKDDTSLRDVTDQVGLVSVNGADLRYLGSSSGLFFTRLVLTGGPDGKHLFSKPKSK